jgi:hypothetical protein
MQTRYRQLFIASLLSLAVGCSGSSGDDVDQDSELDLQDPVCSLEDPDCPVVCVKSGFGKCQVDPCAEYENGECPPEEEPVCTLSAEDWKDNIEAWPIDGLTIGDYTYSNEALNEFLSEPSDVGNAGQILLRAYITAVLNVAAGADSSEVDEAAAAALEWFETYTDELAGDVFVSTEEGQEALEIKDILDAFNKGEIGPGACEVEEAAEEEEL